MINLTCVQTKIQYVLQATSRQPGNHLVLGLSGGTQLCSVPCADRPFKDASFHAATVCGHLECPVLCCGDQLTFAVRVETYSSHCTSMTFQPAAGAWQCDESVTLTLSC